MRAAAWYGLIFALSCVQTLNPRASDFETWEGIFRFVSRKGAHVTEFFVLAVLLWQAAAYRSSRPLLRVFFAALMLAALDEFHQSFVFGRTAQIMDVFIDATGICAALLFQEWREWRESQARREVSLK